MISIETLETLSSLLRRERNCRFEGGEFVVLPFNEHRQEIEAYLLDSEVRYEVIGNTEALISLRQFPGVFFDCDHFLRESIDEDIFNSDIGIIFYTSDNFLYYEASTSKSYVGTNVDTTNYFIQNTYHYLKFFSYFESLGISEYNSSTNHEFILVDPEKGKFLLGYPVVPPVFLERVRLEDKYKKFEGANTAQEFRLLLKRQIIDSVSRYEHDQTFPKLAENIDAVLRDTENNYEMFLRKFNFEELKKNFRKERDQYFENIRNIIDKLLGRVVSIPISVSAAAITIYNLKDDPNTVVVVIVTLAYIIYSIFTSFLLRLLHIDALEINQGLRDDLELIEKSSNIPVSILKKETSKVYKKINVLSKTIIGLQVLLSASSLAVLIVSFQFLTLPIEWIILFVLFVLDVQLLVSFYKLHGRIVKGAE